MWKEQHERIKRYKEKLLKQQDWRYRHGPPPDEFTDDIYTCIQHLHHLKDWLVSSNVVTKEETNKLIETNIQLQIIQEVCNGTKHLTTEFREGNLAVGYIIEDAPYTTKGSYGEKKVRYVTYYNGEMHDIINLIDESMDLWEKYLVQKNNS